MSTRKIISLFLAIAMLFSMVSVSAFAEEAETTEIVEEAIAQEAAAQEETPAAEEIAEEVVVQEAEEESAELAAEEVEEETEADEEMSLMTTSAVYYVSTPEELNNVREDLNGTYYLMNDIDISNLGEWIPIGHNSAFTGTFDGQGYEITGMIIGNEEYSYTGLFGDVKGTICNLGVSGTITTTNSNVGMLAGRVTQNAIVRDCYTTGSVEANQNVGGLIGYTESHRTNYPVTVENCYSRVAVTGLKTGTSTYLGGLIGRDNTDLYYGGDAGTIIKRCYATGYIRPKNDNAVYGGVIGGHTGEDWTVLFCYYDKETVKAIDTNKGFAATTAQMKSESIFTGWDFENVWAIDEAVNDGYPHLKFGKSAYIPDGSGTHADPYIISTQADLIAITDGTISGSGVYYTLANDIILDAVFWTPIGGNLSGRAFDGYFDGAGHTISGLNITQDNFTYNGLFGFVTGTITNLCVDGIVSIGINNAGILAGRAYNNAKITNCYTAGKVEANQNVGGLLGSTESNRTNYPVIVENCYSRASITGLKTGTSNYLGGLIGRDNTDLYYGGDAGTIIKRCYATGYIRPKNDNAVYGGVIGGHTGEDWTVLFCYYDRETVKAIDTNKGFAATTAQMKTESIFTGWDFENVWGLNTDENDGYPYLKFGESDYENDGSGSKADPYVISTQEDLVAITEGEIGKAGSYYELAKDIILDAVFWTPIGGNLSGRAFDGYFDGAGHTISGLNITQDNFTYNGLFGFVTGTITNLCVDGVVSIGNNDAGILAGRAYNNAKITNCYTTGKVEANQNVGGLLGSTDSFRTNYPVIVENCYSRASVTGVKTGTSNYLGGLIGKDNTDLYYGGDAGTIIKRCYATGYIEPKNDNAAYGGVIGGHTGEDWTVLFCYYDRETVKAIDTNKGFAATTSQMKTEGIFTGWDFENVWGIDNRINNGYPYLKFGESDYENEGSGSMYDPYIIRTQEDLIAITDNKIGKEGSYYKLANDIELDAVFWTPIGGNLSGRAFNGYFDGAGYTISGLNITQDNFTYNGLFGFVTGTITNLCVDGVVSIGNNDAGILAGRAYNNAKISNCYTTGTVEANQNVGGLLGSTDSYRTNYPVVVENCYSKASVRGITAGTSDYLGGLIGKDTSNIYYNNDAVTTIKSCYAVGDIFPQNANARNIGGIIGALTGKTAEITACYYDQITTGMSDTGKGIPYSTEEMKNKETFVGFDFDTVWAISSKINNGYPYLMALIPEDTIPATGVRLSKNSVTLKVGSSETITATVLPENATNQKVLWESSNNNIATVSNGKIVAKAEGTVIVTATTSDGGFTANCTVTVTADASSVTVGDANGDGEIDFADAIVVLKHDAGVATLAGDKFTAADANADGEVDFVDAILILKYDSGLISSFK